MPPALMVIFSTPEQAALAKIMEADFELDAQTRQELLDLAKSEETAAADLYRWTNVMNENMQPDEKISIIEQLWQIILADHEIDDYEANLMRRFRAYTCARPRNRFGAPAR